MEYEAAQNAWWIGRDDGSRLHQKIEAIDLRDTAPTKPGTSFLGFCSDEGVKRNQGRPGAIDGPAVLRQALCNLPVKEKHFYDCGNVICNDEDLESAQQELADHLTALLNNSQFPLLLGGGHEISWGTFQGLTSAYPGQPFAIVNIDAHFDLRPLVEGKGSSGTPFLQMANWCQDIGMPFDYTCIGIQENGNSDDLFSKAKEIGVHTVTAESIHLDGINSGLLAIDRIISEYEKVYLSVCLDAFASPFAPGVSAPQALGLLPWQVIPLIRRLVDSKKVVCMDIAEMNPHFDLDNRTAQLAAALIAEVLR